MYGSLCRWWLTVLCVPAIGYDARWDQWDAILVQRSVLLVSGRPVREGDGATHGLEVGRPELAPVAGRRRRRAAPGLSPEADEVIASMSIAGFMPLPPPCGFAALGALSPLQDTLRARPCNQTHLRMLPSAEASQPHDVGVRDNHPRSDALDVRMDADAARRAKLGATSPKSLLLQLKTATVRVARANGSSVTLMCVVFGVATIAAAVLLASLYIKRSPSQQEPPPKDARTAPPQPTSQRDACSQQSLWDRAMSSQSLAPSALPGSSAVASYMSRLSLRQSTQRSLSLPGQRFTFGSRGAPEVLTPRNGAASLDGVSPRPWRHQEGRPLCPCLVVPEGMELVFAVRDLLIKERQQISFSVVDTGGTPLSHVIVNEAGPQCGIVIQMLDKTPLAWVRTKMVHERRGGLPEICWPSGEVFCSVVREEAVPTSRYMLRDTSGQRLLTFHGDFREKAVNVLSPGGRLVCDTERCDLDFDGSPHYQVRVAPNMDAGLVLCGLLAIDKLEGSTVQRGMPASG